MKHLIIIINPLPKLYIESLIAEVSQKDEEVYIFTFYGKKIITNDLKKKLKANNKGLKIKFFDYLYKNSLMRYLYLWKCTNKIRNIACKSSTYYIVHPNHIITNYILFSLAPKYSSKVNLIPDGLANYYPVNIRPYKKNMFLKTLVSCSLLLRYKNYSGDYLGLDTDLYHKHFYINPYRPISSKSSKKIGLEISSQNKIQSKPRSLLIIGFDFKQKELIKNYVEIYSKFLDNFKTFYENIDYKPHPAEVVNIELLQFLKLRKIKIINSNEIIEDIVNNYSSAVGMYSSSLINARIINKNINLISLCPSSIHSFMPFVLPAELDRLNQIFSKLDIEVYKV